MTAPDAGPSILTAVRPLRDAGIALHWLRPRSKAPADSAWSTSPVASLDDLRRTYRADANVGVRLGEWSKTDAGYLHLIDLDIRHPEKADEAWGRLEELWPGCRSFPCVQSGSGGESRHIYLVCDRAFASRKLARSSEFDMVHDPAKNREVKKHHWEIELFGTGKQAVLPPSVHPDTGAEYVWEKELDLGLFAFGVGPSVEPDLLEKWGALKTDNAPEEDEDDLAAIVRKMPMGLTDEEIQTTIADLPEDWVEDRDYWLQVGMALHHETEGSEKGFDVWNRWASQSEKFDKKDQARVWKSFGDSRRQPVRMATLIQAATVTRLEREHEVEDDTPTGDLSLAEMLGDKPAPEQAPVAPLKLEINRPKPEIDKEWRSYLEVTEQGGFKTSLHNTKLIVQNDPRIVGVIAFNQFSQEVVQVAKPRRIKMKSPKPTVQLDGEIWDLEDGINGDLWSDSHDNAVRAIFEAPKRQGGYGIKVSDRDLRAAIDLVAQKYSFHPVRQYLSSLEWDGIPRMEHLFIDYLGAEDNAYHRKAAAMFLLGAVTRVIEPGHKFDFVPVLEGIQGKRKSTFVQVLARHESWFAELEGDFHDTKGMVEKMQGAWILELPELQGFSRAEVTTIKGFLSRLHDKVRMAYAKRATVFPRQCIFLGTTNEEQYLRDSTGNRRFWPVRCEVDMIDIDRLRKQVDQIWAEAFHVYTRMREEQSWGSLPLYLSDDVAQGLAKSAQENRAVETAEQSLAGSISVWLDQPVRDGNGFDEEDENRQPVFRNEVCGIEIWVDMLGKNQGDLNHQHAQKISAALKQVPGWEAGGRGYTRRYGQQRIYRRKK